MKSEAKRFLPKDVMIVTTTQYPDWKPDVEPMASESKVRGDLAFQMLESGRVMGSPVLVIDSELSSPEFNSALLEKGIPTFLRRTKSLSGQRRDAISKARENRDAKVILMNDPEKVSVVMDGLEACARPIIEGKADIVIPFRDRRLFESTYPAPQVIYETRQNEIINRSLRQLGIMKPEHPDFDWLIGARFMANRPAVTDQFLDEYEYVKEALKKEGVDKILNLESWPNGQYMPVIAALKKGLKVQSVRIPYKHPSSQTEFENRNEKAFTEKRKMQLKNIVVGSVQGGIFHSDAKMRNKRRRKAIIQKVIR